VIPKKENGRQTPTKSVGLSAESWTISLNFTQMNILSQHEALGLTVDVVGLTIKSIDVEIMHSCYASKPRV